ncbi:MAG TPA: CDP-alcohol phosphatidyltransferase family protein [Myxococcota bacterium]|nr:CDP-alcohol phosphatidyltransferase family protein [Myxococcota bacterium]
MAIASAPDERLRFSDLFNLAGALTLARIPLAVVTAFTMHDRRLFALVFTLAMLSDVLDGPVARWRGTCSRTGAVADGWADKIFLINYAWSMQMLGLIEPWHMVMWFVREIIQGAFVPLVALRYAFKTAPNPEPHPAGQAATLLIGMAIIAALVEVTPVRDAATIAALGLGSGVALHYFRRDRPWERWGRAPAPR